MKGWVKGGLWGLLFSLLIVPPAFVIDSPYNLIFTVFWRPSLFVAHWFTYSLSGVEYSSLDPTWRGVGIYVPVAILTHLFFYFVVGILLGLYSDRRKSRASA